LDWRFDGLTALVSIAAGKAADLVVLAADRAKNIDDVERVETVDHNAESNRVNLWTRGACFSIMLS
jgi:cytosine/adenosine deaminase-related metal-dependent hydrolase